MRVFAADSHKRIISTLFLHGRLAIVPLSILCDLSPRYVRHGLDVLVQQRLVFYFTPDEGPTVYDANLRNAYDLIRFGKAAQLVTERHGNQAAELVSFLQDHGFAEASELLKVTLPGAADAAQPVNGHTSDNDSSPEPDSENNRTSPLDKRLEMCRQLFASKYVVQLTKDDFLSASDFTDVVETQVKTEQYGGEVKGTRQMAEFKKSVLKKKRERLNANIGTVQLLDHAAREIRDAEPWSKNRRRADSAGVDDDQVDAGQPEQHVGKRRKIGNEKVEKLKAVEVKSGIAGKTKPDEGSQTSNSLSVPSLPTFRPNTDKFNVSFRSQRLVDLSARLLGETTAQVYKALLRRLEHNIPRCHDEYSEAKRLEQENEEGDDVGYDSDDDRDVTATSMEVEKGLDPSVDAHLGFTTDKPAKVKVEMNGHSDGDGEDAEPKANGDEDHNGMSQAMINRQKRVSLVEQHLRLLAEHPFKFLTRVSTRGQGTWSVNFTALSHTLIQAELENLILARHGPTATRIVRILHAKGKLDEKQLGSLGLIRQKDLRRVLTQMQEAGYVDTQEVPRDNTRQPSRTIYLWFYDQDRCRKLVLNDTYKGMSRLLQRAKVEKEKVQAVIDKAERTDVKGQEDKYLSKAEKAALADWLEKEQKLLVQLSREDDLVAIFRDFLPLG